MHVALKCSFLLIFYNIIISVEFPPKRKFPPKQRSFSFPTWIGTGELIINCECTKSALKNLIAKTTHSSWNVTSCGKFGHGGQYFLPASTSSTQSGRWFNRLVLVQLHDSCFAVNPCLNPCDRSVTLWLCTRRRRPLVVACLCQQDVLGVGLLQQGAPELIPLGGLGEHQLVVEGGDAVVDDNIHPVAIAPELQVRVGVREEALRFHAEMGMLSWQC